MRVRVNAYLSPLFNCGPCLLPSQLSWLQRATAIPPRTWHGFCDETIRLLSSFFKAFRVQLICKAFGSEGMCTWTAFLRFSFAPSLDHGVDIYVFLVGLKKYLLFFFWFYPRRVHAFQGTLLSSPCGSPPDCNVNKRALNSGINGNSFTRQLCCDVN